jgi:DNA polymerase
MRNEDLLDILYSLVPSSDEIRVGLKSVDRAIRSTHELRDAVQNCIQCDLHRSCVGPVPGGGLNVSPVMLVGEAPGAEEDEEGVPFVGDSGKLLTLLLEQVGLSRSGLYITNAAKCRPPHNRQPEQRELAACRHHLINEIRWVRPKIIVTLGNPAMWTLRRNYDLKITQERGKWRTMPVTKQHTCQVIHTFHPSFVLRKDGNEKEFRAAADYLYNDLKSVVDKLKGESR